MRDENFSSLSWARQLALACVVATGLGTIVGSGGGAEQTEIVARPHRLSVQTFGSGTVAQAGAALNCGATCNAQYAASEQVTLDATPAAGWTLHHWVGCDSVSGSVCLVTMTGDRIVYPTFATTQAALKPTVKLLSPQAMAQLNSVAGSTLIFNTGTAEVAALQSGDLIVSQVGHGLARRVQAVEARAGLPIFVSTTDAALDEVLSPGTLVYNQPLTQDQLVKATGLLEGAKVRQAATGRNGLEFTIPIEGKEVNGLSIKGSISLAFQPDFSVSIGLTRINEFRSTMQVTGTTNLDISSVASVPLADKTFPLGTFTFAPVLVGPVVLVPTVDLYLSINAESGAAVTTSASTNYSVLAGVQYLASTGWSVVAPPPKHESNFQPPTLTASLTAKAAVGANATMAIYDVAGPYVGLALFVEGHATSIPAQACVDWGFSAGVDGNFGGRVKVLSFLLAEISAQPISLSWPLASGKSPGCADKEPPTAPTNLSVKATSSSSLALEWTASRDDTRVASYRIQRDNQPRAEGRSTQFMDGSLDTDKTYCYKVSAVDSSGNESSPSSTVCGKTLANGDGVSPTAPLDLVATTVSTNSINLRWTPSTDNFGVSGYIVLRNGFPVGAVDVLGARDSGLVKGTRYCYRVVAYDRALNTSPASVEACATTGSDGAWDVYIKCQDKNYLVKLNLDVDGNEAGAVQATGSGNDYDGSALTYVLSGKLNPTSRVFGGEITWAGNSCVRRDTFSVTLASGDTGDQAMSQVAVCGCTTQIRFRTFGQTPLSASQATGLQIGASAMFSR